MRKGENQEVCHIRGRYQKISFFPEIEITVTTSLFFDLFFMKYARADDLLVFLGIPGTYSARAVLLSELLYIPGETFYDVLQFFIFGV